MTSEVKKRNKIIIKYNIAGIILNAVLAVLKIIVGIATNAHAVMLDGVNSFSDMTSSALSIISAAVVSKKASRKHPMGFGRIEYIFSLIITMIVIYIGVTAIIDAVQTILEPDEPPHYDLHLIVIMCISLVVKMIYGIIMRKKGKELNSIAMCMTGTDSLGDSLIAVMILIGIIVYKTTHVDIEHYLCIAISLMIIYTGVQMIRECMNRLVGERIDPEYKKKILNLFISEEGVLSVTHLILHCYGEKTYVGSVDIGVDEHMKASEISMLSRRLIRRAAQENLMLTSVGISATNTSDPRTFEILDTIIDQARNYDPIVGVNSFVVDLEEKTISFYAILDYSARDRDEILEIFKKDLQSRFTDMSIEILDIIEV